jgi:NADH-quinone oxidoreductase subunit N
MSNYFPSDINTISVLPEITLLVCGTVFLFLKKNTLKLPRLLSSLTILTILALLIFLPFFWNREIIGFSGAIYRNNLALVFHFIILLAVLLALIFSTDFPVDNENPGEYYFLILVCVAGMSLMVISRNLLIVFLGMEILSLALYILTGFFRKIREGMEASIKYFLLGSFSSAVFLLGLAFMYGVTGQTNLDFLHPAIKTSLDKLPLLYVGVILIITGLGFKIAAAPFHMWAPDIYEGAPASIAALLSVAPKIAALAVIYNIGMVLNLFTPSAFIAVIITMSIASMIIGNFAALKQSNLIRMLAYSGIAQVGYILISLTALPQGGGRAMLFYLFVYIFMNMGAFGIAVLLTREKGGKVSIDDLVGLASKRPLLAFAMSIFLISLAGIPPTGGFFAKFYVFKLGLEAGYLWVVIVAIIATIVSVYYYFRIIVHMYMSENEDRLFIRRQGFSISNTVLMICAFLLLLFGIISERLLNIAMTVL